MAVASKHPHSFGVNFNGVVSYVATTFVWLLALVCVCMLLPTTATNQIAYVSVIFSNTQTTTTVTQAQDFGLRMALFIMLLIIFWIFCFVASRILSRITRRFVTMFKKKVTTDTLAMMKYTELAIGLILLVILIMFIPDVYVAVRAAIAFLGFGAGIVGLFAVWLQEVLAARYKVPVSQIL